MTAATENTPQAETSDPRAAETVFYDGGCPICAREVAGYRRMAGAETVEWVDVATAPEAALPEGATRQALLSRFTVRRADGATVDGAAGFFSLWRRLGPTARIARLLDRRPFTDIAEGAYRLFLLLRPLWRRA
ncbi:MAG: DUF393 domain-containing protein [Pseudomonadota bacterium]